MALPFTATGEKPEWASAVQWNAVKAVEAHGSGRAAERALGMANDSISKQVRSFDKLAALHGHAPGHWNDGVAPGYRMGKVTVQRGPGGVERVWERQSPEPENIEHFMDRCDARLANYERLAPLPPPQTKSRDDLTNMLGLFDLHIGEKTVSDDPAGRWDIEIARRTIRACVSHALHSAPKAKRLVLCFGGDAGHYDSKTPVTPKSRHIIPADGDADDMVDAVLDVAIESIDLGLATHEQVTVLWMEGNHDEFSSIWMRRVLKRLYENEPRVTVVQSRLAYYALLVGKVMLCFHHGHGAKLSELSGKFAALFREMWGKAIYAYAHAGHYHHLDGKENNGLLPCQHPSLSPSSDYALSKGLTSQRGCLLVTYNDYGEVGRITTRPEMLMLGLGLGLARRGGSGGPSGPSYADFVAHITTKAVDGAATWGGTATSGSPKKFRTTAAAAVDYGFGSSWVNNWDSTSVCTLVRHAMPTEAAFNAVVAAGSMVYYEVDQGASGFLPATNRNGFTTTDGGASQSPNFVSDLIYWDGTAAQRMNPSLGTGPTPYTWT